MTAPLDPPSTGARARPMVIVAGLGRCGSSLVMQMLHAAGVPCSGEPPAFEPPESSSMVLSAEWLAAQQGRAFKWLDPQRSRAALSGHFAVVIFLTRDITQQTASMAKFAQATLGIKIDRSGRRRLAASFRRDAPKARAKFSGMHLLRLTFEQLVQTPADSSAAMAMMLMPYGFVFNVAAAAKAVRQRSAECYPGLLEIDLIEDYAHG